MLEMAFQYSLGNGEWVPCTDMDMARKDIDELNYALLIEYVGHDNDDLYVRCPKHREDEKVSGYDKGAIITVAGCRFEGLAGIGKKDRRANSHEEFRCAAEHKFVPFRWRIFQRNDNSPINIAADVLYTDMAYSSSSMKWRNFSFSIDVEKRKMVISKIRCSREGVPVLAYANKLTDSMKEWTEAAGVDVPQIVADYVMELLRGWIGRKYGIKPSVLSNIKGKSRIKAFVARPFDLHVVFLKNFLKDLVVDERGHNVFDKAFPYEQKDNYKKICNYLKIEPPKSLRRAYTFNPYSIVWYMLFKQWGIGDVNLMQKFLYLEDNVCGVALQDLHYSNAYNKIVCCKNGLYNKWEILDFYCKWLVKRKREKKLLKWLYSVSTGKTIFSMQWDILRPFREYFDSLSNEVKDRLAHDGLTAYVHDAISTEITNLLQRVTNKSFHYDDKALLYECRINQFEFRLVHDTAMLAKLGVIFNNCVASYRKRIAEKRSIIVYLLEQNEYLACIELNDSGCVIQALGKYNKKLNAKVSRIVKYWAGLKKIGIHDGILENVKDTEVEEAFKKAVVEEILYEKSVYDYSLEELLALDDREIKEGYYLRLQEMIGEASRDTASVPLEGGFADEKSELMCINPQGKRIYEAAFSGNTEAMRALGHMYHKGEVVRKDDDKALEWFLKAADLNDESAEKDAKLLGVEMGIMGSLQTQDIYYALKSMKPGWEKELCMSRFLNYNLANVKLRKK